MRNYSARIHLPLMSDTGAEMSVLRTPSIIAACTTWLFL